MKTVHMVPVGNLRVVLRSDGGVYVGQVDTRGGGMSGVDFLKDPVRIGSSAAICDQLGDALKELASEIRRRA